MDFHKTVVLGRTGLSVGRLGISSGDKAPTETIEEAFEENERLIWISEAGSFAPRPH